jgi:hypothetical protein
MNYSKKPDPLEKIRQIQAAGYTVKIDGKVLTKKSNAVPNKAVMLWH